MKKKITLLIDSTQLFDTVNRVGVETAGNRFVDLLLSLSSENFELDMRTAIGAALYGIEIEDVKTVEHTNDKL